jgi:hypothetical protein
MFKISDIDKMYDALKYKQTQRNNIELLFANPNEQQLSLRDWCVIAKTKFSGSAYGTRLEKVLKDKFHLTNKLDNNSGDAVSSKLGNIEIKVSLGDKNGGYCIAQQVRPHHCIDYYLCLYYNIIDDFVTLHLVPSNSMIALCQQHGGQSHGTKTGKHRSTELGVFCNKFNKKTTKAYKVWEIIQQYEKSENELLQLL